MSIDAPIIRLNAALEGRYRIERELGEGGMATVYLADDLRHERKVALKVLKPELAAVVGGERFLAEIKTTANLQHPHILPLFDSGMADSFLFYVMPYVEGESLRDRLDRERQLPVDEAVQIATDVAEALAYAHGHGVIHRDIKPANILLHAGRPVISDFGIALAVGAAGGSRLTETGLSMGTPYYMSPEQATGDQTVGPSTDVYALGCVLYEMLVGEPPYTGSTAQAILGKIIQSQPVSPTEVRKSVPANVDATVRKALEKIPADRFTGAHEFVGALAWSKPADGTGEARLEVDTERSMAEFALSPDERWVVFRAGGPPSRDLMIKRLGEEGPEAPLLASPDFDELAPSISPDGRWLAYGSNETGVSQIYVRPFPDVPSGRWQITSGSGFSVAPRWSHDGTKLFYWDEGLTSVSVDTSNGFSVGPQEDHFPFLATPGLLGSTVVGGIYAIGMDDQSVLMARMLNVASDSGEPELILVQSFFEELRQRVPTN